ncbi:hypothetical protein E3N88_04994 [Mikania micrantha]|uniref:Uncharacterized protein n=1 Tax=Mikania micrantha TaxID=192012 RepID=A0A5N6PXW1_9ASTR|nr:hypothetical protein E3N88_04994 [Mikania micrantha]
MGPSPSPSPELSPVLSRIPESPNNYGILTPKEVRVSFHEERCWFVTKAASEIDEDDPFLDDDLPDEYKQLRYSKWSLLQLFSLILIIAALIRALTIRYLKHKFLFDLELWKWEALILVLICGGLG